MDTFRPYEGGKCPRSAALSTVFKRDSTPVFHSAKNRAVTGDRREPGRWLDAATPLEHTLWRQHNVISSEQAAAFLSEKSVRERVNSGRWQRVSRRVMVAHSGPLSSDQQLWAAILSVGRRAFLAGITAAQRHGFRPPTYVDSERIHIVTPAADRHRNVPGHIAIHRTTTLRANEIQACGDPPSTTMDRSIVDAASWARTDRDAYALVVAAYQQQRVTPSSLNALLDRLIRLNRRQVIIRAVTDAEVGVHSELEGLVLAGIADDGLPLPTLQYKRRDAGGRLRYLDGYYKEWRLHIEIDGAGHINQRSYWNDMKRQNQVWIAGDRVLRFPAVAVRYDLAEVIGQIRQALLAAGWRP